MQSLARRRVAVFVDFDNAFSGLRERSPAAAEAFGSGPRAWLRWLEEGMPASFGQGGLLERAILVRKCYLNPGMYGRYRQHFAEAGFQVMDCPPLTGNGKTSADMLMVLEIMDALQRQLYDEFIIFSGDADFTPVLLRLRAHDHRTAVVVTGNYARVMHGAADVLIESETFMRFALKIAPEAVAVPARVPEPPTRRATGPEAVSRPPRSATPAPPAPAPAREDRPEQATSSGPNGTEEAAIMEFLRRHLAEAGQPLSLSNLGMRVRTEFASVARTGWFGRGGFGRWLRGQRDLPFTIFTHNGGAYIRDRNASAATPPEPSRQATPLPHTAGGRPASPEPSREEGPEQEPPPLLEPVDQPARPEPQARADEIERPSFPYGSVSGGAGGVAPQLRVLPGTKASEGELPPASGEEGTGPVQTEAEHARVGAHPDPPSGDQEVAAPAHNHPEPDEPSFPAFVDEPPPPTAADQAPVPSEPETPDEQIPRRGMEESFLDSSFAPGFEINPVNPGMAEADRLVPGALNDEPVRTPAPFTVWPPFFADAESADSAGGSPYPALIEEPAAMEAVRVACNACGAARRPGHPRCMACGTPV